MAHVVQLRDDRRYLSANSDAERIAMNAFELLHNRIDLSAIPFTDRGSRLRSSAKAIGSPFAWPNVGNAGRAKSVITVNGRRSSIS